MATPGVSASREYDLFAVTAHGLAGLCAAELAEMGVSASAGSGGAAWRGSAASMYRANLELRTASRVVVRVGEFRARGFAELERRVAKLSWPDVLHADADVVLRVTSRKSKLYHEGAIAERIARVLMDVAGARVKDTRTDDDDAEAGAATSPGRLVVVRFLRDECIISVDSSGALLHQRGYRQELAKAPLRETIAAAMLLASGWRADSPLLDPFCGAGTIPIEAALIARRIAPGIANAALTPRAFAFEQWPDFDPALWSDIVASTRAAVRDVRAPIIGSDRDAGAIAAARANAVRAGVDPAIEFRRTTLTQIDPPPGTGHLITNPPYGVRIGDRRELRALYAALGNTARARLPGWTVTFLTADDALAAATGLPLAERLATRNGGIPVRLLTAAVGPAHGSTWHVYDAAHEPGEDL